MIDRLNDGRWMVFQSIKDLLLMIVIAAVSRRTVAESRSRGCRQTADGRVTGVGCLSNRQAHIRVHASSICQLPPLHRLLHTVPSPTIPPSVRLLYATRGYTIIAVTILITHSPHSSRCHPFPAPRDRHLHRMHLHAYPVCRHVISISNMPSDQSPPRSAMRLELRRPNGESL